MINNKTLLKIAATFLPILLTACMGDMGERAQNMLYPVDEVNKTKVPEEPPEGYHQVYFVTQQEPGNPGSSINNIHAWYKVHSDRHKPVIVYLHGNGMNIGSLWEGNVLKAFDSLETHWAVVDFPGYGRSSGVPSMPSINAATDALMNWVKVSFPHSKIIVWGRSMGAAVAAQLAERHQASVHNLILTSPWADAYSLAKDKVGSLVDDVPKDWFEKNSWKTTEAVRNLSLPTLTIHGTKDKVIPIKFGKQVFASFPEGVASFLELPDRAHNDIFGSPEYWQAIRGMVPAQHEAPNPM